MQLYSHIPAFYSKKLSKQKYKRKSYTNSNPQVENNDVSLIR